MSQQGTGLKHWLIRGIVSWVRVMNYKKIRMDIYGYKWEDNGK
jgi:hypothetical protein